MARGRFVVPRRAIPLRTASAITARAAVGERLRAEWKAYGHFTTAPSTPGTWAFTSATAASSPETASTGTP